MRGNKKSVFGNISRRAKILLATSVAGTMFASSCGLNEARAVLAGVDAVASQLDRSSGSNFGNQVLNELGRLF